jgi:hypothetical protein
MDRGNLPLGSTRLCEGRRIGPKSTPAASYAARFVRRGRSAALRKPVLALSRAGAAEEPIPAG